MQALLPSHTLLPVPLTIYLTHPIWYTPYILCPILYTSCFTPHALHPIFSSHIFHSNFSLHISPPFFRLHFFASISPSFFQFHLHFFTFIFFTPFFFCSIFFAPIIYSYIILPILFHYSFPHIFNLFSFLFPSNYLIFKSAPVMIHWEDCRGQEKKAEGNVSMYFNICAWNAVYFLFDCYKSEYI